jgi:glycosyltransferase involved in cell wall biosynthesis
MKILVFLNGLGLGGTEKAACRWTVGLKDRGHELNVLALADGPRRAGLEQHGIPVQIVPPDPTAIAGALRTLVPQVIHAHAPGHPHAGDVLGEALQQLPKIPVVQTNIFGQLFNPKEDAWTDFRLFISWTSCVQAARRVFRKLDEDFFRRASVAVYPLDPVESPDAAWIAALRETWGLRPGEVLFGRFSRPDPNKWSNLALDAFLRAAANDTSIKLLLREPPPAVAAQLRARPDHARFIILPATSHAAELELNMAAVDVVLHTSSIGESFGYGIAEPMSLGRPVITHSVPWHDQAQIELVRHEECGFVASTPPAMGAAMMKMARNGQLRERMGVAARAHVRQLADVDESLARLEGALSAALAGRENPRQSEDLARARAVATYLDTHEFGHSLGEKMALFPTYWRNRLAEWRRWA